MVTKIDDVEYIIELWHNNLLTIPPDITKLTINKLKIMDDTLKIAPEFVKSIRLLVINDRVI